MDRVLTELKAIFNDARNGVKNLIAEWKAYTAEVRAEQERFQNGMQEHADMFGIDETEPLMKDVHEGRIDISDVEAKTRVEKFRRQREGQSQSEPGPKA